MHDIGTWTKLMIVGGYPSQAYQHCEFVDLSGQTTNCPSVPDIPLTSGSTGTFINGQALACGGEDASRVTTSCWTYDTVVSI